MLFVWRFRIEEGGKKRGKRTFEKAKEGRESQCHNLK